MNVPGKSEEAVMLEDETINPKVGAETHAGATTHVPDARGSSRAVKLLVLLAVLVAAGVGAKQLWGYFDSYESTDDAQIEGHLNGISSRISGTVTEVHFENNQKIVAGEVLVELDPRDYRVSLEQAKASMGLAASQLTAERPNVPIVQTSNESVVATFQANISQAEAAVDQAVVASKRASSEAAGRVIAQRQASLLAARTQLSEAVQNNPRQLLLREATVQMRQANIAVFKSQVGQAELNLSYTTIVAPVGGIAGKKSVEVGEQVRPGQQLLAISQTDEVWVTANFKETQLKRMHPGQTVSVTVDALDRKFDGLIESMPGATGAVYSVLPPENATGNYVKVVQRLPVRIRLKRNQAGLDLLHPGMSVEPVVRVRQVDR